MMADNIRIKSASIYFRGEWLQVMFDVFDVWCCVLCQV